MIIHQVVVVNQLIMDRMIRVWDGNVAWLWWWEESEVGHGVVAREGGGGLTRLRKRLGNASSTFTLVFLALRKWG